MGELSLFRDGPGGELVMGPAKPLALLVYVALSPRRRVSRDQLAELFWPGVDLRSARHSLRQSVYRLRMIAGDIDLLPSVGFDLTTPPSVSLDCLVAEGALEAGDLARASELLDNNFMEGFEIPGAREVQEWTESQRTRFRELWARSVERMVRCSLEAGQPERALELANGLMARRPFNDEAMRLVMAALAAQGRHATALARYAAYAEFMRSEDEQPGIALRDYAAEVENYHRTRAVVLRARLPFVGRDRDWAILETAWAAAEAGNGSAVLVEGVAGQGKTRILSELEHRAEACGGTALIARCYEPEQAVPYAAVADALSLTVDQPKLDQAETTWLAEAARLLPELGERFPQIQRTEATGGLPASKRRLHHALIRLTTAIAEASPVLLAVDDVHWADTASLEVLHAFAHHIHDQRVLLVASYRPAELQPAARRFARSLAETRLARLISLEPLSSTSIAELIQTLGRFEDPEAAKDMARELHQQSAGNPLFLSELLEALARTRLLYVRDGTWQLGSDMSIGDLPRTIGKLLADRVDALEPWMRACLEVLAVCGEATPVELLAHALDLSEPRAELALSVLQEERLARRLSGGTFELIHDELRSTVYRSIPDERRRLLHAAVGAALETQGVAKRPTGAARLAYHYDQAGEIEPAHRYAVLAAGEAADLGARSAQRDHLEVAAAHAMRALPPGQEIGTTGGWSDWLRRQRTALLLTVALAVFAIALIANGVERMVSVGRAEEDYRQGTFYLRAGRNFGPTHRVRWPSNSHDESGTIEELHAHGSGLPPMLLARQVSEGGETHEKVFVARGRDTVQLTFGRSDDMWAGWAPDARSFLVVRGWRVNQKRYQQNLFVLDPDGRVLHQLTATPWQDGRASWSPLGTEIAFNRDSAGSSSIWVIDADGRRPRNLTARLGLPKVGGYPAYSPDGQQLAIVYPDTGSDFGTIYLAHLHHGIARSFGAARRGLVTTYPVWSPDGRWLAYASRAGSQTTVWAESVDGAREPRILAQLPFVELYPMAWIDKPSEYAAHVEINPSRIRLGTAQALGASATVTAEDGRVIPVGVRWDIIDTTVARVDDTGFLRGHSPGSTMLIASAGGFVADTVPVDVSYLPVDTLFYDDWTHGLDTLRWEPFGEPAPLVVAHPLPGVSAAFLSNGDYNNGSGVLSKATFEVGDEGLTLEASAWLEFTGSHWQIWGLGFTADSASAFTAETYGTRIVSHFEGHSPTLPRTIWSCGFEPHEFGPSFLDNRWLRVGVQIRPDGYFECTLDGRVVSRQPIPPESLGRRYSIMLRGHSVATRLYHGPVLLTRGLLH